MSAYASIFAMLAAGHLVAVITPGPNNALVLQTAGHGRRAVYMLAAGIFPAGIIWATLGMAGVGQLIKAAPAMEMALRIAGGLYLLWLGAKLLRSTFAARSGEPAPAALPSDRRLFITGFMTNFTNPKAIAWYTSIFAAAGAFVLPWYLQALAIVGMPALGALWYVFFAFVLTSAPVRAGFARCRHWIDRCAAGVLIAFGLRLLISH